MMTRRGLSTLALLAGILLFVYFGNDLLRCFESDKPSQSYGSPGNGRIEYAKRLPTSGPNFRSYSRLGALLGRTSVHDKVRAAVVDAFESVRGERPDTRYTIGETGWPGGGRLRPHVSHQNGLSVDFMIPVRRKGVSVALPTNPWNIFGYGLQFDDQGKAGDLEIDFEAMAAHLDHLERAAQRNGIAIEVVIFDNELQKRLFATQRGAALKRRMRFSKKEPWIRHDEHYHVDFRLQ